MDIFQNAVDTIFDAPGLSVLATYTPAGGSPADVKVIQFTPTKETSLFATNVLLPSYAAEVRVSEMAIPLEGDLLSIGSDNFKIKNAEYDSGKLCWRLYLEKQ